MLTSTLESDPMFKTTFSLAAAVLMATAASSICAAPDGVSSVSVPVTKLQFGATGVTDAGKRELLAGPAYGDLSKGPHGTFIRMPAGFVSPSHIHTGDYWGVVIAGVAVNGKPGSADVLLPVGSYWFQKGGEDHVTKCVSANECLFFISQGGKFDYLTESATR